MKQIETLSSLEGRSLLYDIYQELRFEKQLSSISTILLCWRLCTNEKEIFRYTKNEIVVVHPLGFLSGTALWLEEIVNRFFFSTINSFVYFGAAVLLILIGIRRFSENFSDNIVIAGVIFEALMLMFMFVVMLFSPPEEYSKTGTKTDGDDNSVTDLILEVGEIATDFASAVVNLEQLNEGIKNLIENQKELIEQISKVADSTSQAVSPNPLLLATMKETSQTLENFRMSVENLNETSKELKKEHIEATVRKELERLIFDKISNKND